MAEWTWEPDDFAALWYSEAHDRFPSPLRYTSRFAYRNEFAAHRIAVRARYSADELEQIQLALRTLGDSDIRIEILGGTCKHKQSTSRDDLREYRIVGARTPHRSVTLTQFGNATEHGRIRLCMSITDNLPTRIVAAVPACRPGTAKPATFHPDELRPLHGNYFEDVARNTPHEQYRRLLGRQADGGGTAALLTGPIHTHSKPSQVLQWYDITDDGRYTETRGAHITVRPTTPADLTTQFTTWIDRALQRLEEQRSNTW
ncbi:ESX secretion-associated protein EspG [Nocardia sp. CA-129566]|uniref:ESX secretion-associated protein EspG n=1 Tax=Nocardia sp. CA-129566 TaxID=3239976 RepID=UPI003D971443